MVMRPAERLEISRVITAAACLGDDVIDCLSLTCNTFFQTLLAEMVIPLKHDDPE